MVKKNNGPVCATESNRKSNKQTFVFPSHRGFPPIRQLNPLLASSLSVIQFHSAMHSSSQSPLPRQHQTGKQLLTPMKVQLALPVLMS